MCVYRYIHICMYIHQYSIYIYICIYVYIVLVRAGSFSSSGLVAWDLKLPPFAWRRRPSASAVLLAGSVILAV